MPTAVKLRRFSLHPWHVQFVLRPAVDRHTEGVNEEKRRLVKGLHEKLNEAWSADETQLLAPETKLPTALLARRRKRNDELRLADPEAWKASPEYAPLPTPDARDTFDFTVDEHRFARAAVQALMSDRSVDNTLADGLVVVMDALDDAKNVEACVTGPTETSSP